jgi:kynurenine formamidase
MSEWQDVAARVRNWGRWGPDDELGTLNFVTSDKILEAARLVRRGRVIPLGIPLDAYGPQTVGFRTNPLHVMTMVGANEEVAEHIAGFGGANEARLVEQIRSGPGRYNDDYLAMFLQAGTQLDAFSHFYYDGQLYNGFPASCVTALGATRDGVEKIARAGQIVSRGVLLDVARQRNVCYLDPKVVIYPEELDAVAEAERVVVGSGDVVIVRTGWWPRFVADREDKSWRAAWAGLSWRCAEWFHERQVAAVAADNIAVEASTVEEGIWNLFHMLALRDMGMPLGEIFDLEQLSEDCAEDRVYDFQLIAQPLQVTGAVASPLHPLAIK